MRFKVKTTVDKEVYAPLDAYNKEMAEGLVNDVFPGVVDALQARVAHWKSPPEFEPDLVREEGEWRMYIWPMGFMGRLWDIHVQGVEPRVIKPRFKMAVSFTPRGMPKHQATYGGVVVDRIYEWPGIESKVDEYITKAFDNHAPTMRERIRAAAARAFQAMQESGAMDAAQANKTYPKGTYARRSRVGSGTGGGAGAAPGSLGGALSGVEF